MRVMGRVTQGVRIIKLNEDDDIAAIAKVDIGEEKDELIEGGAEQVKDSVSDTETANDEIDKSDQLLKSDNEEENNDNQ
jgi:DNA gyrase subunit A